MDFLVNGVLVGSVNGSSGGISLTGQNGSNVIVDGINVKQLQLNFNNLNNKLNKIPQDKIVALTSTDNAPALEIGRYLLSGVLPSGLHNDFTTYNCKYGVVIVTDVSANGSFYKQISVTAIDENGTKCITKNGIIYNGRIIWE